MITGPDKLRAAVEPTASADDELACATGDLYTVTYRQHPVGIATARSAIQAIRLVHALCGDGEPESAFRARTPKPHEAQLFGRNTGTAKHTGCTAFFFF